MAPSSADHADPLAGLVDDLDTQREFLVERVPVYAAMLAALIRLLDSRDGESTAERLRSAWSGRAFDAWYERPLLLLAALRADAMRGGAAHPLSAAVAVPAPDEDAVTTGAVAAAMGAGRDGLWHDLRARYLQTNETSRAVAWLWPARLAWAADPERPVALFDVGASAGLNLVADRLAPMWYASDGTPVEVEPIPAITRRAGFDLRPMDVHDERDAQWLRACVWAGQNQRLERLDAAITAFRAAARGPSAPCLATARAAEVPARLPTCGPADPRALVCQTVMRDYLPDGERAAYEFAMTQWLHGCAPGSGLWAELEIIPRPRDEGPPAALTVHVAGGGDHHSYRLARCEPHPLELHVDAEAVDALHAELAG